MPGRWRVCVYQFVLLLLCVGLCVSLPAQVAGGTFTGTVTDPSGRSIPKAKIIVQNVATGVTNTVPSNSAGSYSIPGLNPGTYIITASAPGFVGQAKAGITLTVGNTETVDFALKIGSVQNTVTVTAAAPQVQVASSDLSAVANSVTVKQMPLNGRSWTDLAALQAGVATLHTQPSFATGGDRGNRGFGQQLTINGARPQQNNYRLDGVSLNDYGNGAPGSVLGGNLGVDAIQEFSVLSSNYSAAYGKTSGGVVNAITKSGTNSFHGGVYEFIRNSRLDARNFFDSAKPEFRRNQFGGDLGGPIWKNHAFFFFDYEGVRQAKGNSRKIQVPSTNARNGILADGTVITNLSAASQKFLQLYPAAPSSCATDVCSVLVTGNQVVHENYFITRLDTQLSNTDSMYGTFMFDKTPYNSPDKFVNVLQNDLTDRRILAVQETHTFSPALINAVRFGYNFENVNNNEGITAINPEASDTSLGGFPGTAPAGIQIGGGVTSMPGGVGSVSFYVYNWRDYQFYDDAFYTAGNHSIKFGFNYEHESLHYTTNTDPSGIYKFKDLQSFLTGTPDQFRGGLGSPLTTPRTMLQGIFGAYIQDDWRVSPTLTVNMGLRYEMATVPTEADNRIANLPSPTAQGAICGTTSPTFVPASLSQDCGSTGPFFSNPTTKNFEPRVGFAWQPFGGGSTAVRGGIGLFDVLPLPYQFTLMIDQAAPFFQYTIAKSNIVYPPPQPPPYPTGTLRATYIPQHPKRNYVVQYNLNIQHQFTQNLAGMIAYVGSEGIHMPFRADEINAVAPIQTSAGWVYPQVDANGNLTSTGAAPATINPFYNSVRMLNWEGRSYYNALELQLSQQLSHGLQVQGDFTWGKSIDTSSATLAGDQFSNSISSPPLPTWYDLSLSRGLSDFNVSKSFVLSGIWDIPAPKNILTSGWELGGILTLDSGVPFTPTWGIGNDPMNSLSGDDFAFPDRVAGCKATNPGNPNQYINTKCFTIPQAPDQAFWNKYCDAAPPSLGAALPAGSLDCYNMLGKAGRNTLIGPGVFNLDFSLYKNNYIPSISENFNAQFRVEVFNILNHPNFSVPSPYDGNTDIFAGDGTPNAAVGQLLTTSTPERQIQFALKLIF